MIRTDCRFRAGMVLAAPFGCSLFLDGSGGIAGCHFRRYGFLFWGFEKNACHFPFHVVEYPLHGDVAQLVRAPRSHRGGRGFEPLHPHQTKTPPIGGVFRLGRSHKGARSRGPAGQKRSGGAFLTAGERKLRPSAQAGPSRQQIARRAPPSPPKVTTANGRPGRGKARILSPAYWTKGAFGCIVIMWIYRRRVFSEKILSMVGCWREKTGYQGENPHLPASNAGRSAYGPPPETKFGAAPPTIEATIKNKGENWHGNHGKAGCLRPCTGRGD